MDYSEVNLARMTTKKYPYISEDIRPVVGKLNLGLPRHDPLTNRKQRVMFCCKESNVVPNIINGFSDGTSDT